MTSTFRRIFDERFGEGNSTLKRRKNGQMVTTIVARSSNFQRYREETLENDQVTILVK